MVCSQSENIARLKLLESIWSVIAFLAQFRLPWTRLSVILQLCAFLLIISRNGNYKRNSVSPTAVPSNPPPLPVAPVSYAGTPRFSPSPLPFTPLHLPSFRKVLSRCLISRELWPIFLALPKEGGARRQEYEDRMSLRFLASAPIPTRERVIPSIGSSAIHIWIISPRVIAVLFTLICGRST